jgi:hypothetical protein
MAGKVGMYVEVHLHMFRHHFHYDCSALLTRHGNQWFRRDVDTKIKGSGDW